jgi:multiple sugar transport system substrate-binding protein
MLRRRTIASLVVVSLISALLVLSCGGGKKAAGSIRVLNWGTEQEGRVWNDLAADFQKKTGIKVEIETAEWSVYWDKINTLYAANTPPEVFAMDAPLFMDWYSRDALAPLQPYLDKDKSLLDGVYPQTLAAYKTDKGYYGLPRDFQTIALFYNKDMFDAAKVKYPDDTWTYDDLRTAAKKLTLKSSSGKISQWGFQADLYDIEAVMSEVAWAYGGDVLNADRTKTTIGDKIEGWKLLSDMVHVDKSIPDQDSLAQYGSDAFLAGKAAMVTTGHWSVPTYQDVAFKWDVAPMPKGPAGRATSINSAGFVMAKNCKNPDAGWEWIKYVLSKEGQTRLAQLGFAIPIRKEVAESAAFLNQSVKIDHKVFLDSIQYAHMKPVFRGYDRWSAAFGDAMSAIYKPEAKVEKVLAAATAAADAALAESSK